MKRQWWQFLYNLVLALWVGGISIFTFIVTPVIFRSFGRDMAGRDRGEALPGLFSLHPPPLGIRTHPFPRVTTHPREVSTYVVPAPHCSGHHHKHFRYTLSSTPR